VFVTLEPPTDQMKREAVVAGCYHSDACGRDYPKIQILTNEELLHGTKRVEMPPERGTFKQAQKVGPPAEQPELEL